MTTRDRVLREIQKMPETMLGEVLDFVVFLETKISGSKTNLASVSEASLKKDWLKPEEDKAWRTL